MDDTSAVVAVVADAAGLKARDSPATGWSPTSNNLRSWVPAPHDKTDQPGGPSGGDSRDRVIRGGSLGMARPAWHAAIAGLHSAPAQ